MNKLDLLNPVTRLGISLLLLVPILFTLDWVSATTMLVAQLVSYALLGVPLLKLVNRLIPIFIAAPIAAISMLLYGRPGGEIYFKWGLITISEWSVQLGIAVLIRVFALAVSALVLISDLDTTRLADGLAQVAKLPARFVLGALAGMRMLSLFISDWRTMTYARRARGLEGKFKRYLTMAFALLVFAIRRGTKLATAMEARGFSSESAKTRTWARESKLSAYDVMGIVVALGVCAISVFTAIQAGTFWLVWTQAPS